MSVLFNSGIDVVIDEKNFKMKYTLEQIIKCWREVYGEDMETEYTAFIKELQKANK